MGGKLATIQNRKQYTMTPERIKEIHSLTAYPESISVRQALLQVWNECEQDNKELRGEVRKLREGLGEVLKEYEYSCKLMAEANGMFWSENNVSISAKQLLTETK